jgi:hypothetical protein
MTPTLSVSRSGARVRCPTLRQSGTGSGRAASAPSLYRDRNALERYSAALRVRDNVSDCCVATLNNKLATNFLAAVQLAVIVSYWL